jgi:WD40 repeat protein
MKRRPALSRLGVLALLLLTVTARSQPALRVDAPNGGERFTPSDSIDVAWRGSGGIPVRVEVERADGAWWRFSHAHAGDHLVIPPDSLPTGRYRTRLTRVRSDSTEVTIVPVRTGGYSMAIPTPTPDGREIAVGGYDGVVRFWDIRTGALARELTVGDGERPLFTGRQAFSADGRRLLLHAYRDSGFHPAGVWLFYSYIVDPTTGIIHWSDTSVRPVSMSPDGALVSVANVVRRVDDDSVVATVGDELETPRELLIASGNRHAASRDGERITLWSLETGRRLHTWEITGERHVESIAFSPDGKRLAAVGWLPQISVFDVSTGDRVLWARDVDAPVTVDYSNDGHRLAIGHRGDTVSIYDGHSGTHLRGYRLEQPSTGEVRFAGDDARIVTVTREGEYIVLGVEERLDTVYSDSTWEMLPPRVSVELDGDFGPTIAPSAGDSVRSGTLVSRETIALRMTSARIVGPDSASFHLYAPQDLPRALTAPEPIRIGFRPRRLGEHEAALVIDIGGDTVRHELRGLGALQPVQRRIERIDFGAVPPGVVVDTVIQGILENADTLRHKVTITLDGDGARNGFRLIEGGGSYALPPGQRWNVQMRFLGRDDGHDSVGGTLLVEYDGLGRSFPIALNASAIRASSAIDEDDVRAAIIGRTTTTTTLRLDAHTEEIVLANMLGETVRLTSATPPGAIVLEHGVLPPGMYLLIVRSRDGASAIPLPARSAR